MVNTLDFWGLVLLVWFFLLVHLMSQIFTYLGFGLPVSGSLNQKFHGVLCEQRNQQSIVYAGPVTSCEGSALLTGSTLGGTVMETLCSV